MFRLVCKNMFDFIKNKTGIFIFFILTLIIVSFSGIFLMNEMARSTFNESGVKGEYFLQFEEPVEYAEIQAALDDSFLFPSTELYIDHNALKYNDFPIQNNGGVIILGRTLKDGEPVGIYGYEDNSVYLSLNNRLVYGRKLRKEDSGLNNATISYHLEKYVEKGKITANETIYSVIGSYETFLQIDKNSISVSPETFSANGNKAFAFFATFEIPPLKSSIDNFERIFENNKSISNSGVMNFFSLNTVWILLKNCMLYFVVLLILLMGLTGVFYCYINNSIRNYAVYELCGMNKFEKKCCISAETLIYTLFSNFIGIGLYYLLLSSDYKITIRYPHPIIIVADICLISLIAVPMSLIQYRKIEKNSIVNKL